MSYRVSTSHVESLHNGRFVADGDVVSEADAKDNPRLIERGVLVKEPDKREQRAKTTGSAKTEPEPAPKQEKKEESK